MPASPECEDCLMIGIHSRKKRVYYRLNNYKEIGWFCPTCCTFTLDIPSYIEDMKAIFDQNITPAELKKNIAYYQKRFAAQRVLRKKIKRHEDIKTLITKKTPYETEAEFIVRKGSPIEKLIRSEIDKKEKEPHPSEDFAE